MKARLALLTLLATLVLAAPAIAGSREPMGGRICLLPWCGYTEHQTYPENEPFHVLHGWGQLAGDSPIGLWHFELEIDGVLAREDYVDRTVDLEGTPPQIGAGWVFNFPGGMTGEHTFVGRWSGPCQPLVDMGLYPGPCVKPMELVLKQESTAYVTFVP